MYRDAAVTIRSALLTSRAQYKSAFIRRFTIERSCPFPLSRHALFLRVYSYVKEKKEEEIYMRVCVCVYIDTCNVHARI